MQNEWCHLNEKLGSKLKQRIKLHVPVFLTHLTIFVIKMNTRCGHFIMFHPITTTMNVSLSSNSQSQLEAYQA